MLYLVFGSGARSVRVTLCPVAEVGHFTSIVTRLLISPVLHHRLEGSGWYIRALSTRILVILNGNNNNNNTGCLHLLDIN